MHRLTVEQFSLVPLYPNIIFAKDTNNDGRNAESRQYHQPWGESERRRYAPRLPESRFQDILLQEVTRRKKAGRQLTQNELQSPYTETKTKTSPTLTQVRNWRESKQSKPKCRF